MKRTRKAKRGGIRFANNTAPPAPYEEHSIHQWRNYLPTMRATVRNRIPVPSRIQENDASTLATVIETYDTPEEMMRALELIYDPQPLTQDEYDYVNRIIRRRGMGTALNVLNDAPFRPERKEIILNHLRYYRAVRKIEHMFVKKGISHPRFVHAEWGPNTNEKN